ncbi:MAG: AzlC family ABC transporter permease [Spirochaetota bacterium]
MARHQSLVEGMRRGIPVVVGYFPIALAFGMLAREQIPFSHAVSMSALVFAGASQFMALELLSAHARAVELVAATFLMNFRHFIMSIAVSHRLAGSSRAAPLLAFGLTDETFAVAATRGNLTPGFMLGVELVSYSSWVSGTAVGYLAGSLIHPLVQQGMGIALYALFAALLVPHIRRSFRVGLVAASAAGFNTMLHRTAGVQAGWSLVIAVLLASLIGSVLDLPEASS